jgi:hypothetical protein
MAIYKNTPPIVTSGLVLALDAANRQSYVSESTTWSSLASPSLSATLINGPTYSVEYGGGITCNGINNSINMSNSTTTQFPSGSAWSFSITTELLSQNTTYPSILSKGNSGPGGSGIIIFYAGSGSIYFKHNNDQPTQVNVTMNRPFQYAVTYAGTGSVKIYVNGIYRNNSSTIVATETGSNLIIGSGDTFSNIRTYSFLKYSKELTPQEVLQNFNATKTRFNLT